MNHLIIIEINLPTQLKLSKTISFSGLSCSPQSKHDVTELGKGLVNTATCVENGTCIATTEVPNCNARRRREADEGLDLLIIIVRPLLAGQYV